MPAPATGSDHRPRASRCRSRRLRRRRPPRAAPGGPGSGGCGSSTRDPRGSSAPHSHARNLLAWLARMHTTTHGSTPAGRTTGAGCRWRWRSTPRCSSPRSSAASSPGRSPLLADAGHVLSDVGAIAPWPRCRGAGLALGRPAQHLRAPAQRGACRLVNGLALIVIAVLVAVAALGRLSDPPEVEGAGVLVLGLFGLAGNAAATVGPGSRRPRRRQPRSRPAALACRRAGLARRRRLRRGDPRDGLARGRRGREPRGGRPDPAGLGSPRDRAARRSDGVRAGRPRRRRAGAQRCSGSRECARSTSCTSGP